MRLDWVQWARAAVIIGLLMLSGGRLFAQTGETITSGESITGTLTEDAPAVRYHFSGKASDQVSATLSSFTFDALLRIENADGDEIASNDDTEGSLNAAIDKAPLSDDGEYTLVVTSSDGEGSGEYRLTFSQITVQDIAYGDVIEDALSDGMPSALYQFDGEAGDIITIWLTSRDFDPFLTLMLGETEMFMDDDSGGGNSAMIGGYTLPESGSYLIIARSYTHTQGGSFRLQFNQAALIPIEYNSTIEGEMNGETLFYSFEGKAGDRINVSVDGGDSFDTTLNLRTPLSFSSAWDDDSGRGLNPEFTNVTLEWDGTYMLMLQPLEADLQGDFTLTLNAERPEALEYGETRTVTFGGKGHNQAFRFDAKAGDTIRVTFRVDLLELGNLNANLVQNGETFVNAFSDPATPDVVAEAEVPADGEVVIMLSDYNYRSHSYEMTLERLGDT